jgi:hypothetical protein
MISGWQRNRVAWVPAAALAVLAAACAAPDRSATGGAAARETIADPVMAFAAAASPGAEDSVVLAGSGQPARLRLVRSYMAASGRECREVEIRAGGSLTSRLFCRAGAGWREARPLISGGTARP